MIRNMTNSRVLAEKPLYAGTFFARLRGMIGRSFRGFDGMLFDRCNAVHTFFMKIPLDVCFISEEGRLLKIAENLPPWVPAKGCRGAYYVLELPAGKALSAECHTGDLLNREDLVNTVKQGATS